MAGTGKFASVALRLLLLLPVSVAFQITTNARPEEASLGTPDYFMKEMWTKKAKQGCLSNFNLYTNFANPTNSFSEQMHPDGKVFLVGDSVIGQVCQLGSPGLCCSSQRVCDGARSYRSSTSPWEIQLDKMTPYSNQEWQHLFEFKSRGKNNTAANTVYFVAPVVHDDLSTVNHSVELVAKFLREKGMSEKDVLVMGMLGNHYNHGLMVFDEYINKLVTSVANPFPGRVVMLGYSPQHFSGSGHFTVAGQACSPSPLPGDVDPPRNSFRGSIFLYNVWKRLTNKKARLVDLYELLNPLWACHRVVGDCTHWVDPVISMQAQLILNALEKIQ